MNSGIDNNATSKSDVTTEAFQSILGASLPPKYIIFWIIKIHAHNIYRKTEKERVREFKEVKELVLQEYSLRDLDPTSRDIATNTEDAKTT